MNEEIYLSDLFTPVLARWKTVLVVTLIGAAIGLGAALMTPRSYEATATIFVRQSSPIGSLRSSLPIAIGGSLGSGSTGYYLALLESETILRKTIATLDLLKDPRFTRGEKLDLRRAVDRMKKHTVIKDNRNGGININSRWNSPEFSAKVANGILDSLQETTTQHSSRNVRYIELKLAETTKLLDEAQDRFLAFQKKSGVPVIEEEGKRLVETLNALDAQLLRLDVDLTEIDSDLSNAGELEALMDREVRKRGREASREHVVRTRDETLAKLNTLPDIASQYIRLQREVTVLSKTFELLTERYQLARIEQQGEGGEYQVIDRARPPVIPLARGTVTKTAMGGMVGLMFAAIAISAAAMRRNRGQGQTRPVSNPEG